MESWETREIKEGLLVSEKGKKDEKSNQPSTQASIVDSEKMETCEAFRLSNNRSLLYAWVLDSGASFHMPPHKYGFVKYQPYSGGMVYLGDE